MKVLRHVIALLFLMNLANFSFSQQLKENEIVVIRGEKFVLHQVRTGETVFSISQKFGVERSELIKNNPEISEGLKIGDIIKIPYREGVNIQNEPIYKKGDPSGFKIHTIKSRTETPYFIAKEYGITVEELYAYNPQIRRYKRGTRVRIPLWEKIPEKEDEKITTLQPEITPDERNQKKSEEDELISHQVKSGETLYSISQKYNVSESEIIFLNPDARKLKAGDILYLPKKEISEKERVARVADAEAGKYFDHIIVSGETIWGITRKYDVSEEKLKSVNPVLHSGFPAGVTIKIPVQESEITTEVKPVNQDAFLKHFVEKGETLYGLASEYDLTIPEIKQYNPVLEKRNLVYGETVLIPKKPDKQIVEFISDEDEQQPEIPEDYYEIEVPVEVEIPESCQPGEQFFYSRTEYDVALFLPLFLEANDTLNKKPPEELLADSLAIIEEDIAEVFEEEISAETDTLIEEDEPEDMFFGFYRNTENFVQFYEGVLLAVDSMQRAGMKINLNVYDTQHNADSIRNVIYREDFLETDLIIGPVYHDVQNEVAAIAAKNRIPMVSPLSAQSNEINSNPYYYQVNPSREYIAMQTADLISEEYFNSNFIIFKTNIYNGTTEGRLVNLIHEKLYNSGFWGKPNGVKFSIYDFQNEGPFGFRRILSKTRENVVFIPSSDVGELSIAVSNINNLAGEYPITLIGTSRLQQYESIQIEHFHNLNLEYIAPYWVNYKDPASIRFFEKFRESFYTDPGSFGIQGYDVSVFFLNALKTYGREFNDCLPYLQTDLVQGNYRFEKVSPFGGFMNEGVSVISFKKDFEVVRERVIGQYKFAQN